MKNINFNSPHRKKHFDFFNGMNHPYFGLTANVDISHFYKLIKAEGIPFTPALVYLISRVANEIKEFKWRIRDNSVIEHDIIHPSFTVLTDLTDVFSFCYVKFDLKAKTFIDRASKQILAMQTNPSLEDDEDRDDYLFMSGIPWVHFTSMQHAMQSHPGDTVPRIVWGQYRQEESEKLLLPISVQVHHAVVDGRHVGLFYDLIQTYLSSSDWIKH